MWSLSDHYSCCETLVLKYFGVYWQKSYEILLSLNFLYFFCIFFDSHTGALLAKREEIAVVIVNSRLGALGYLYDGPGTGNMGLWDNILALQYIQDNIAAYGGDPNKVIKSAQRNMEILIFSLCSLLVQELHPHFHNTAVYHLTCASRISISYMFQNFCRSLWTG